MMSLIHAREIYAGDSLDDDMDALTRVTGPGQRFSRFEGTRAGGLSKPVESLLGRSSEERNLFKPEHDLALQTPRRQD